MQSQSLIAVLSGVVAVILGLTFATVSNFINHTEYHKLTV